MFGGVSFRFDFYAYGVGGFIDMTQAEHNEHRL